MTAITTTQRTVLRALATLPAPAAGGVGEQP